MTPLRPRFGFRSATLLMAIFLCQVSARAFAFVSSHRMDAVGTKILKASGYNFNVHVVFDAEKAGPIAGAGPVEADGTVTVYMNPRMLNEDENTLAFVLGHEFAHKVLVFDSEKNADLKGLELADRAGYKTNEFAQWLRSQPETCSYSHGCLHYRAEMMAALATSPALAGTMAGPTLPNELLQPTSSASQPPPRQAPLPSPIPGIGLISAITSSASQPPPRQAPLPSPIPGIGLVSAINGTVPAAGYRPTFPNDENLPLREVGEPRFPIVDTTKWRIPPLGRAGLGELGIPQRDPLGFVPGIPFLR